MGDTIIEAGSEKEVEALPGYTEARSKAYYSQEIFDETFRR